MADHQHQPFPDDARPPSAPADPSASSSHPPQDDQQGDGPYETPGAGKRKRGDEGTEKRSKRNRYTAVACNQCKRRKIKCNGENPCQRCGNLQLECVYTPNCCSTNFKDTQEYRNMNDQVQSLEEQVNVLWQSVNTLRNGLGYESLQQPDTFSIGNETARQTQPPQANMLLDPALGRNQASPQRSKFQGPTSSQYNFDLARSSLQSMGINTNDDSLDPTLQPHIQAEQPNNAPVQLHASVAPFTEISKDEALRLCRVYEDEMGLMYPILDMNRISQYATLMFTLGDAVRLTTSVITPGAGEPAPDADMEILKLVLANAMVAESGGRSQLAQRLFASCSKRTDVSLTEDVTLKNIQLMTLVSMYLFHSDQETRSWRMIGVAARLCVELGLHRSETYSSLFASADERDAALRLFWSVYVLDKRWSLGTGMVTALTDPDIDFKLGKPYGSSPYLACMVDYSKIGSEVWNTFGNKDSADGTFNRDKAEYLNYQVLQWYKNIPKFLKYTGPKHADYIEFQTDDASQQSRALYRLQIILYLRANQMRILIYRPVLHSAAQMLSSDCTLFTQKVIELAQDSIRTLWRISQGSDIYQTQQMCFNYFLVSALAVLFLAVSHAPGQYAVLCRDEFYRALDLVRGLSAQSAVSERLWKTIRGLKEIGPKLGLYQRQSEPERSMAFQGNHREPQHQDSVQNQQDAASSAAMAMAGLRAGRPVDESDFFGVSSGDALGTSRLSSNEARNPVGHASSPNGMANDLMSLFEAAGAFASGGPTATYSMEGRAQVANMGATSGGTGIGMAGGHEDDFGRIMRDLF